MRRLFDAISIDFDQWKALMAVLLKLDFRTSTVGSHPTRKISGAGPLIFQIFFFTMVGVAMAFFVTFTPDLFVSGTIAMGMTMFVIGSHVLLDHNSAIASPNDYLILGFRPITSRTYLAVRVANVFVYTTAITTLVAWLPIAALFNRYGSTVGSAGIVAFYACASATALAILTGYAWIIGVIGPNAIKRALSYVQLVMGFLVYGGYMVMSRVVTKSAVSSLAFAKTPWLLFLPMTWFASYLEIADGKTGLLEIIPAAISLIAFAALISTVGGRLSLDYSERLGALLTASSKSSGGNSAGRKLRIGDGLLLLFRTGEARSVALLVRSQFQNDQRFRLGVLGFLPLTLLYIFMGVHDHAIGDPFVRNPRSGFSLVTFAVMMFPSAMKTQLTRSESFRASWIFFVCPVDRMKIVRASKDVLVVFFLVPYLAFLTAIFTYLAGNLAHVVVHIALLGCLSHLFLQIVLFMDPELPFSKPPARKGQNTATFFTVMAGIGIVSSVLQALSASLYSSRVATAAAFGVVLLASAAVDRITRVRVERQTASQEFEG